MEILTALITYAASFGISEEVATEKYEAYCDNKLYTVTRTVHDIELCTEHWNTYNLNK